MGSEPTPPGEYLLDELRERGISQARFAEMIDMPAPKLSLLINGEKRITPARAIVIGQALGTSAEVWTNLEASWRLHLQRLRDAKRMDMPEWLLPVQVAAVHNITRGSVIKRLQQGFFKRTKVDDHGRTRIHRDEVLALIPKLEKKHV